MSKDKRNNELDETFEEITEGVRRLNKQYEQAEKLEGRRNRNFDRAVLIVARLNFEGVIRGGQTDFYDYHFGEAVKAILDMLEKFQLDSPDGQIVDIFTDE